MFFCNTFCKRSGALVDVCYLFCIFSFLYIVKKLNKKIMKKNKEGRNQSVVKNVQI